VIFSSVLTHYKYFFYRARSEVFIAVMFNVILFWCDRPCHLVNCHRRVRYMIFRNLLVYQSARRNIPENFNLVSFMLFLSC